MTDQVLLFTVALEAHHKPTGRTRHTAHGKDLPSPSSLAISRYPDDNGIYLLYIDQSGREITDTFHEFVEEAMTQAEFEFGVLPNEWLPVVV